MTADSATSSTSFVEHRQFLRRPNLAGDDRAQHHGLFLLPDTRSGGPRGPHPGDVLYWVACVGGACLLLLAATT
jgi:hypothetical protein